MLELDDLLAPISKDHPAGEDLSFSAEFDAIQEARRADDPTLDQGEWVTDIKYADWPTVDRICDELLRTRTKDLRVAAWHTEASAQLRGFSGLAAGLRAVAGLCEHYWDQVHPQDHDAGHEERIGNLGGLLANAGQWVRTLPITQAPQGSFGLGDFEAAHARGGSGDNAEGQPGLDVLEAARRGTSHGFYTQLLADLPDCRAALEQLRDAVDTRLGADGPSFSALFDQLEHLQHTVARSAREAGLLVDGTQAADDSSATAGTGENGAPAPGNGGPIASRRQALAQLREVAEFFRRTEPHSPVAYLADKAASWGEMPLHVWLKRVIKDDSALAQVEELLDVAENQESFGG